MNPFNLFRIFRRRKSIDGIIAPMSKIVRDLEAHSMRQHESADKLNSKASILRERASSAREDATAAEKLATNYKSLIKPEAA